MTLDATARELIRLRLSQAKAFLAQESPPRLSESDTKANFIEPIVAALGWEGIGVVTREYYVRNSQEFIDYVMSGPRGPLLAIEAKPLQADLTEKHAAQLIQYCAVEGIEWAALTNGRELQFFNSFLKPDLAAKRILRLDLLAFNTDFEFEQLFDQIWQLSRERMMQPAGVRSWLNQRRLDTALRELMTNPSSSTLRHVRKELSEREIAASSQEVSHWFRTHLLPAVTTIDQTTAPSAPRTQMPVVGGNASLLPGVQPIGPTAGATRPADRSSTAASLVAAFHAFVDQLLPKTSWRTTNYYTAASIETATFLAYRARSGRLLVGMALPNGFDAEGFRENKSEFNWKRITKVLEIRAEGELSETVSNAIVSASVHAAANRGRSNAHYGVSLAQLVNQGAIAPNSELVLLGNGRVELARAVIDHEGVIVWNGQRYRSPSDRAFGALFGRTTSQFNGWSSWHVQGASGSRSLFDVRQNYLNSRERTEGGDAFSNKDSA